MQTTEVGIREFRENLATYLESMTPVAMTRHGATIGVYVPTRPRRLVGGRLKGGCSQDWLPHKANTSYREYLTLRLYYAVHLQKLFDERVVGFRKAGGGAEEDGVAFG